MGCSSQMGCLGPKPREREVYLDLIEAIYRQAQQMDLPKQQDSYEFIKVKLTKKGLLRKLTDNLKSHKTNIYECVNQNFQISSQSNLSQSRVISLIVVDKIMEELFKINKNTEESVINERYTHENPLTLTKPISTISNNPTWNYANFMDFDQRIDIIFFKQIIFLLQNEKMLENRIIGSIILFCKHKQEKIIIKSEIYTLLDFLYKKMSKKQDSEQCFKAFQLLLKRLKENLKEEQKDMKYIKFFMNIGSRNEDTNKEIAISCRQILIVYFSKYFNDYLIIYKLIMELFDEYLFKDKQVQYIWELMVSIAKQVDNYNNFVRGIFIFLLRYIMVNQNLSSHSKLSYKLDEFSPKVYKNIYKQQCKLNAFKMVTHWIVNKYIDVDESIVYSSAMIVMTYITNYVLGSSQAIKQELKKQFYKIIALLNVKSNEIIIDLLIEQIKDRQTPNKKRKMVLVVIKEIIALKKMLANPENIQNYNIIIIIQPYYSLQVKLDIINCLKFILKSIKSQYVNGASYDSTQLRLKLCELLHSIYACILPQEEVHEQSQNYIKANFFRKSKNTEDLNEAKAAILQMNKFTAEIISIIKILLQQHFYIIVVAFIESINESMANLNDLYSDQESYVSIYFIELIKRHALFSINKRQKMPEEILKLHLKLEQGHISTAIRNDVITLSQRIIKQCQNQYIQDEHQDIRNISDLRGQINILIKSDYKRIFAAKQFYMFNQMEYGQVLQTFRQHFRYGGNKSAIKKEAGDSMSEVKFFHRNSSLNMSREEFQREKESMQHDADESFRDILTKINQR